MESVNKNQHWNNAIASPRDSYWLALIAGVVLIAILAGVTGFSSFLGMLIALVLFLMVLVIPRPILIVYGLALIMPLTDGLARGAVVPILRLGQSLLVLASVLFLLAKSTPQGKSRLTAIDLAFALFFLSETVFPVLALYIRGEHLDLTNPGPYGTAAPVQTLLGPLQYYLVYRIAVATIISEKQIATVLKLSFIASIVVSLIGILENFVGPVYTFIQTYYPPIAWANTGPLYGTRITSTMESYVGLASYLTATLIVALACSTVRKGLKIHPLLLSTTLLFDSMALLLTGTFSSFFGLAIGAAVVFLLLRRLPRWIIIALIGVALSVLFFQSFFSARLAFWLGQTGQGAFPTFNYRIMLWKDIFLPAVGQNLLFGAGPAPAALNAWPTEETQYLSLLLRGGLPYFFSYFLLMGAATAICWHRFKNKSDDLVRTVAIAALGIIVAINIMNVSSLYFTYPGITQTLFMLLAIVVASKQLEVQELLTTIEQTRENKKRSEYKTLPEPLKETTGSAAGKRVEVLLTEKRPLYQSLPTVTRLNHHTPPLDITRSVTRLRRVINNTIISFLGQAVIWASTLALTIAYGHFLGAFKFGELYFAVAFVTLIGAPVNSGFGSQAIRDVAQEPGKAATYFSNLFLIRLVTWLILYALVLLASWLLRYSPEVRILTAICGFDLLFNALASTFASLHYAFERTIFPVAGNIFEKGLVALISILLLKAGAGVQAMAVVIAVGSLINGIWQAIWLFRLVGFNFAFDLALIRQILRANIPFFISGVLLVGYTSIDTILLSLMTNNTVVGWYGAAQRITDTMSFIPTIVIMSIMYPIFSKLSLASDTALKLAIEKTVNFLLFCGIPIATIFIVAAPNIIQFLYQRNEFSHSVPVLQAAAPGMFFIFISFACWSIVLSKKQDRRLPIVSAVALICNLGLNLILIHLYQHVGAAIASSLTELLVCCTYVVFIPRHLLPFGSLRVALKVLIASMVMALIILLLHASRIYLVLPIALLVYLGAVLLFRVISREDYQAIYRAIQRKAQPTSRINDMPETFVPSHFPDESIEDRLATTLKLPTVRPRSMQHSSLIQKEQTVLASEENGSNNGGTVR